MQEYFGLVGITEPISRPKLVETPAPIPMAMLEITQGHRKGKTDGG